MSFKNRLNKILYSFQASENKKFPGCFSYRSEFDGLFFDLKNHKIFHPGDLLFYIFSINQLSKYYSIEVSLPEKYIELCNLFLKSTIEINKQSANENNVYCSSIHNLDIAKKFKNWTLFNFSDTNLNKTPSQVILHSFCIQEPLLVKKEYSDFGSDPFYIFNSEMLTTNYLGYFHDKVLFNFLSSYVPTASNLIVVGTQISPLPKWLNKYKITDMRSKTSFKNLVDIVSSVNCIATISYDNLIMHLSNIFKKKCFVLNRHKFTKSDTFNHLNYINNNFYNPNMKYIEKLN